MANLPEEKKWEGVYQLETSDRALGGPGGVMNKPLINLVNRTALLKSELEKGGQNLQDHLDGVDPHPQYAPKESPELTGIPTVPTAKSGTKSKQIASTEFVQAAIAAIISSSSEEFTKLYDLILINIYPVGAPIPWMSEYIPDQCAGMVGQTFVLDRHPLLAVVYPDGIIPDCRDLVFKGASATRAPGTIEMDQNKAAILTGRTDAFSFGDISTTADGTHNHTTRFMGDGVSAAPNIGANLSNAAKTETTSTAPNHSHVVQIPDHDHAVEVYLPGGDEVRVRTIGVNYIVRMA